jgi:serine protease Do
LALGGQEAHPTVVHDGHSKDVALKVKQLPGEQTTSNAKENGGPHEQLGLALAPLSPEIRNQLDVLDGTSGAVVHRYGRDRRGTSGSVAV